MHLLRGTSLISTYLIGKLLIITYIEPGFPAVRSSGFQDTVYFLDQPFRKLILRMLYYIINTTEMIHRLHDVINIDRFIGNADGVRLIDVSGLLMRQEAPLYMIGIICKINLRTMVNTTFQTARLFLPESRQKRKLFSGLGILPARQRSILRNIPCLSCQESALHLS